MPKAVTDPQFLIGVALIVVGLTVPGAQNLIFAGGAMILGAILAPDLDLDNAAAEIAGRTVTVLDAIGPWQIIYGNPRVGGTITYMVLSGSNGQFLNMVITIAGHEVESIDTVYFNDEIVPLSGVNATGRYSGHARIEKALGASNQAALTSLIDQSRAQWVGTAFGVKLNGAGHFLSTVSTTILRPATITVECLIRVREAPALGTILAMDAGADWKLELQTDLKVKFTDAAGTNITSSSSLGLHEFFAISVVGQASGIELFVDAISKATTGTAYSGGTGSGILRMGSLDGKTAYFKGDLDNVRVWNIVRLQSEILADLGLQLSPQGGLVGLWNMTEGSGNTAADTSGSGLTATLEPSWTTAHRQRGRAYIYVRLKWNTDLFPQGIPNIAFDVKGKKLLDPRTGQTVTATEATDRLNAEAHGLVTNDQAQFKTTDTLPAGLLLDTLYHVINETADDFQVSLEKGGSVVDITDTGAGTHTVMERKYSDNAALVPADYLMDRTYGLKAPLAEIGETALNAAANVSDETVNLAAGGTESRYTCNGAFASQKTPQRILNELLSAMGGQVAYVSGQFNLYAAAYRAPTLTLTESDMRSALRIETRQSRQENFNAVKGIYTSPGDNWQAADYPPVTNAKYEADDGERTWFDLALPYTISASMAQRLAKITLERMRQSITVRVMGKMTSFELEPPDVVQLTNLRLGWTAKPFELRAGQFSLAPGEDGAPVIGYDLQLRETAAAVYDFIKVDVTATPATDRLNATAHGLVEGNAVNFRTTGTLPAGLAVGTVYSVINPTADDFQVTETVGGSAVDITDTGTGTHTATMEAAVDLAPNTGLPDPLLVFPPANVVLASGTAQLDIRLDGTIFSRIKVSWDAVLDEFVISGGQLEIQYKKTADANYQPLGFVAGSETFAFILDVRDGVAYDVRIRAVNSIGAVSAFITVLAHTVIGKTAPPADVTGFNAQQNGILATMKWNQVPDRDLKGYEIRFGVVGLSWEDAQPLTEVASGTLITTASIPPGPQAIGGTVQPWRLHIKAVDTTGNESVNAATFDLVVASTLDVIQNPQQFALWGGTLTNFHRNPLTGHLNPESQDADSSGDNFDVFDSYVINPFASGTYEAPEIDVDFDDQVRVWGDIAGQLGPGITGIFNPKLEIDFRKAAESYDGFEDWVIGEVEARFFKLKFNVDFANDGLARLTGFRPTVDVLEHTEIKEVTVATPGPTAVVFVQRFHNKPDVQVSAEAVAGAARIPTYENASATGVDLRVFDSGGTDVGGKATYTAIGV